MSEFGVSFLKKARRAGFIGVIAPVMDIFQRLELRGLWFTGILTLSPTPERYILTAKGIRFVDAHCEDWP